jgi:hypothetical protein
MLRPNTLRVCPHARITLGLIDFIAFAISHPKQNKVCCFPQSFSLTIQVWGARPPAGAAVGALASLAGMLPSHPARALVGSARGGRAPQTRIVISFDDGLTLAFGARYRLA